jgi:hypothetical protein
VNLLQTHAAWVLATLRADTVLTVLHAKVPTGRALPYVVVHFRMRTPPGTEQPDKVALEAASDVLDTSVYCHSVGGTAEACLAVAGRVRATLLGVVPVIAGRVCFPVVHDESVPIDPDETTGTDVYDLADVYRFTTLPG